MVLSVYNLSRKTSGNLLHLSDLLVHGSDEHGKVASSHGIPDAIVLFGKVDQQIRSRLEATQSYKDLAPINGSCLCRFANLVDSGVEDGTVLLTGDAKPDCQMSYRGYLLET